LILCACFSWQFVYKVLQKMYLLYFCNMWDLMTISTKLLLLKVSHASLFTLTNFNHKIILTLFYRFNKKNMFNLFSSLIDYSCYPNHSFH